MRQMQKDEEKDGEDDEYNVGDDDEDDQTL